jgi:hypothetical protein
MPYKDAVNVLQVSAWCAFAVVAWWSDFAEEWPGGGLGSWLVVFVDDGVG